MSLAGKRVVVTRAAHQAGEFESLLVDAGASVVSFPVITIIDPDDSGDALRASLTHIDDYAWLVFTSVNTVHRVAALLDRVPASVHVAAIGSGTADALEAHGVRVDLVPEEFVAESLLEAFPPAGDHSRVLLPRAAVARDVLPDGLRAMGYDVDVVDAYQTVLGSPSPDALAEVATADVITFTASSTVTHFLELTTVPDHATVACIGPITADTARAAGLTVHVEAEEHTMVGLVAALEAHFA